MPKGTHIGARTSVTSASGGSGGGGSYSTSAGAVTFRAVSAAQNAKIQAQNAQHLSQQDINVRYAVKQYVRSDAQANGRSMSQNLNQKLETGQVLNPTEKGTLRGLDAGMSPIGTDSILWRADHALTNEGSGILDRLGVRNYQQMSDTQLSQSLVGQTWTEKKFLSTSWNKSASPFIGGAQSGGRSVILKINAPAATKQVTGDVSQAEYILARGQTLKIKSARFTGTTAYPRVGAPLKQIELEVDII